MSFPEGRMADFMLADFQRHMSRKEGQASLTQESPVSWCLDAM